MADIRPAGTPPKVQHTLRLPPLLYDRVLQAATDHSRSINAMIESMIVEWFAATDFNTEQDKALE